MATTWGYLPNSGDRRLASIGNTGLSAAQFSNYQFTTTPENFISAIDESSDSTAVYPSAGSQTASYNNLNQLTNLSGQALTYAANGNLTSDGQRTYSWDAENRLVGIGYPSQAGKQTAFTYDGLSRRITIASTPAGGGSAVTHAYIWCGSAICQARNAANATSREYYSEGELVPGSPAQPTFYGTDQIGSVRRAFASTSSAPAYGYDPYGNALQATALTTDFGYAGMFYNADSGLYLTQFRGYDPVAGRWLSRDPLGEGSDPASNLYAYARGNPVSWVDPSGLADKNATGINAAIRALTGERDPNSPIPGEAKWPSCPPRAKQMVNEIGANNGSPLPGYKGGRTYENDGRSGSQVLPREDTNGNRITYREYDINPYVKGVNRGAERVVIGSDGKAYYTNDHYANFIPVE